MTVAHHTDTIASFRHNTSRITRATLTGTGTTYYNIRPGYHTTITVNKNGSTGTMKMTNDFTKSGETVGNVDDEEFGESQSTGTDDYHKGHTAGFTGCEIDITVYSSDVEVVILEYLIGS